MARPAANRIFSADLVQALDLTGPSASAIEVEGSHPGRREVARSLGDRIVDELPGDDDWHVLLLEFWMRAGRDPSIREQFLQQRRRFR